MKPPVSHAALLWICVVVSASSAQTYRRIFDGVSLNGWHQTGGGTWIVTPDSGLQGTTTANTPEGYLIGNNTASNFALRLKFWWIRGNSGVNFRNVQAGTLSNGIQVDIEDTPPPNANYTSGCLYDNVKVRYVGTCVGGDSISRWYRPNAWNDLTLDAQGNRIVVALNGKTTETYTDTGGRASGVFAFQLHVNQIMDIKFKDIEMLDYTTALSPDFLAAPRHALTMRRFTETLLLPSGIWRLDGKRAAPAGRALISP